MPESKISRAIQKYKEGKTYLLGKGGGQNMGHAAPMEKELKN